MRGNEKESPCSTRYCCRHVVADWRQTVPVNAHIPLAHQLLTRIGGDEDCVKIDSQQHLLAAAKQRNLMMNGVIQLIEVLGVVLARKGLFQLKKMDSHVFSSLF